MCLFEFLLGGHIELDQVTTTHYFCVVSYIQEALVLFSAKSSPHEFFILIERGFFFPIFVFLYVFLILLLGMLQRTTSCTSTKKHLVHPMPCHGNGSLAPIMPPSFSFPPQPCLPVWENLVFTVESWAVLQNQLEENPDPNLTGLWLSEFRT